MRFGILEQQPEFPHSPTQQLVARIVTQPSPSKDSSKQLLKQIKMAATLEPINNDFSNEIWVYYPSILIS
jgi:hypothetical protein